MFLEIMIILQCHLSIWTTLSCYINAFFEVKFRYLIYNGWRANHVNFDVKIYLKIDNKVVKIMFVTFLVKEMYAQLNIFRLIKSK